MKFSVGCIILLLAIENIGADEVTQNSTRKEDNLQTYIIESSDHFEDESTTIIPPLIEGEPSAVSAIFIRILLEFLDRLNS